MNSHSYSYFISTTVLFIYISLASCRPQSVQVEKQNLVHVQNGRSLSQEKRGSEEETRRILQEINRINIAMGYIQPNALSYPRVAGNEGYFYPRQQFRPEFLTKPKKSQHNLRNYKLQRAINPFYAQNYYYPTPYLQVPSNGKPLKFKSNKNYYPIIYAPYNLVPMTNEQINKDIKSNTFKLGKIVVLPDSERTAKAIDSDNKNSTPGTERKNSSTHKKKPVEKESDDDDEEENTQSLIEDIVRIVVPEAIALSEDYDEEEEKRDVSSTTQRLPPLKNDKYLNLGLDDPKDADEFRKNSAPPVPNTNRALNFSNSIERIQNLTKTFTFNRGDTPQKKSEETSSTSESPENIKEEEQEEAADDIEESKSPFGFVFGPKQQLQTFKEGGLIIQRLRVRHGGIAIAGPGGVATAGSGGTAIVGPNGIAFTHPRGLAIGGPGARIYAVPESTDLENLALTHKARQLDDVGVLVARGPAIFYNKED